MGYFARGAHDQFIGKVGNVVGSTWKGQAIMRAKPVKTKNRTFSPAQQQHHAKFAMAIELVRKLNPLLKITLKKYEKGKTAFNIAVEQTIEEVITGTYPDFVLDWSRFIVSKGDLPLPEQITAAAVQGGVEFNWDETGIPTDLGASGSDLSVLVIFCPELKQFKFTVTGSTRMTGTATLNASGFSGKVVHAWIAFISDTKTNASESVYAGQLTML